MSKMDNLRAMREARYEQNATRTDRRPAAGRATPPVAPPEDAAEKTSGKAPGRTTRKAPAAKAPETAAGSDAVLCGHRNMGGRSCTREQGHAAKSHRYS